MQYILENSKKPDKKYVLKIYDNGDLKREINFGAAKPY